MKPVRIEETQRYIDPQNVSADQMIITATWKGIDGQFYFRQAAGPILPMLKDATLRTKLLWNFTAAWLSLMAATCGVDVVEVSQDPDAPKSAIVDRRGQAYTAADAKGSKPN